MIDQKEVKLNKMQSEAYDLATSKEKRVYISGSAGSGKSFVLGEITKDLQSQGLSIVAAAYSHKAKGVLDKSINTGGTEVPAMGGKKVPAVTIAVLLGYALEDNDGSPATVNVDKGGNLKQVKEPMEADVCIVDEVGTVPKALMEEITSRYKKVIAVGDLYQLEAIGDEQMDMSDYKVVELTENMRQGGKATTLTKKIEIFKNAVKTGEFEQDSLEDDNSFNRVKSLIDLFIQGKIEVIACFTNKTVEAYNNEIQRHKTGGTIPVTGDTLVLQRPVFDINDGGYTNVRHNGDEFIVESTRANGQNDLVIGTEFGERILFSKNQFKDGIFNIWKEKYKYSKENSDAGNKTYSWMQFKSKAIEAKLPYAQTVHKLLGSTYNTVGINGQDISIALNFSKDSYFRLIYVALSRAKDKVYVN